MSNYNELVLNLTPAISKVIAKKAGMYTWVVMVDDIQDDTMQARVIFNNVANAKLNLKLSEDQISNLGESKSLQKNLKAADNVVNIGVTSSLNVEYLLTLSFNGGAWVVTKQSGSAAVNSQNFDIFPVEFNVNNTQHRELNTHFNVIKASAKNQLADNMDEDMNFVGVSFKPSSKFIAPNDLKAIENLTAATLQFGEQISGCKSEFNSYKGLHVTKQNNESEDGVSIEQLVNRAIPQLEELLGMSNQLRVLSIRFQSADVKQAVGMTSNGYFKDIEDDIRKMAGQFFSLKDSYKYLDDNTRDNEYHEKIDQVIMSMNDLMDKVKTLHEYYSSLNTNK